MNLFFRILACVCLTISFQPSTFHLSAQPLPQGYFRNPLDSDIGLSATFAEFRTGHFHAGLDMRTGGATGKPVHAAADGYVAKVSISPWGGGKILYIKHPNGYTSVYMHLDGYADAIGKAVRKEQYRTQSYSITKLFTPSELPVKKGQVVAYSGNSGGSGGPHLHFEIRRGGLDDLHTHAVTINPLLFGLPYSDDIKPVIRGVRVYPVGGTPFSVGNDNRISVDGPFYLGVYATDAAKGSTAKNGVDCLEVYVDGYLFFKYTTEAFPLDSSRISNALIDFPLYQKTHESYLLTRTLPGAEGPWIPVHLNGGVLRLLPGAAHRINIKVYDIRGNVAERVLQVESGGRKAENVERITGNGQTVKFNQPFSFHYSTFNIQLLPYTLYADDRLSTSVSGQSVTITPIVNDIPPHLYYTLSISGSLPGVPAERTVVVHVTRKMGSPKYSAYKTTHANGLHTAQVRDWGEFTLAADTVAPRISPVNFRDGKSLKANTIKVKVTDNLSGVESYNCYLNGQWILGEYDGKTATVTIDASDKIKSGANKLRVEVVDAAGNVADVTYIIRKT